MDLEIVDDKSFDNAVSIQQLHNSTLMIHGENDRLASYDVAKTMFDSMPSRKKYFFTIKNEGHNYRSENVIHDVLDEIDRFLEETIP